MNYSPVEIRSFSLLGQRGTFGKTVCDLAEKDDRIYAMTADQGAGAATKRFQEKFPERFLNFGISEQNAVGVCAGMANEGLIPFVAFQAVFASIRAADQVRVMMSYMSLPVKLVGIFAGVTQSDCGPTHFALQDIALFRAFPNVTIISPADGLETALAIEAAAIVDAPVYIRLSGETNIPMVYRENYKFEIGRAITLKDGKDICIFATGSMVHSAIKIAKRLEESIGDLSVRVVDLHTISPLDVTTVRDSMECKFVVSMEEHSVHGGLGGAIAEVFALEVNKPPLLIIGTPDHYVHAGEYRDVLEDYGLSEDQMYKRIFERYALLNNRKENRQ